MSTQIIISSFTKEEQVQYAQKMIALTDERIAERGVSSRFDQVLADLLQAKTHYILMLESDRD